MFVLRGGVLAVSLGVVCATAACKREPGPSTSLSYVDACSDAQMGKRISTEGYLEAPSSTICKKAACGINFNDNPNTPGTDVRRSMLVVMPVGTGANEMAELPKGFGDADVKFHTKKGDVSVGQKVRMSALVTSVDHGKVPDPKAKEMVVRPNCELNDPILEPL